MNIFFTLVNVYVDLVVFTRIGKYYIEKHAICLKDHRLQSFLSIQYVHGDLCKYLGIYSIGT